MPEQEGANTKRYKLYICLDPLRTGILCEVAVDPGMALRDLAGQVLTELMATHRRRLAGITPASVSEWVFLHGDLRSDRERLDGHRTLHDLAVFPEEIIFMGPARCFERWAP